MSVAGQAEAITRVIPGATSGTGATASLVSPTRVVTTPTATNTGGPDYHLQVLVPAWTAPGIWHLLWTVTGPGAGTYVDIIDVAPTGYLPVAPRSYATTTQLANYLYGTSSDPQPLPDDAEGRLGRATARIDRCLKSAIYPVDANGEPTLDEHKAALAEAVCELVAWWVDTGDESGAMSAGGSVTAGQISLSRAGGKPALIGGQWVSSQVVTILENATLLGHRPIVY